MITLIQFHPAHGVPNLSPFCVKAEVLLKMSGQPYETELDNDPRKGPLGKYPAIRDNGRLIGDSALIRAHLESAYGVDFDPELGDVERAAAHAFCRMVEERTYWAAVYSRWIDPANAAAIRKHWFGDLPVIMRSIVPAMVDKQLRKTLHGHGIGRHPPEQIYEFGKADIRAVASWLGDKPFFMGPEPTGADATIFGFMVNLVNTPFESPLTDEARRHANLVDYSRRCMETWFSKG